MVAYVIFSKVQKELKKRGLTLKERLFYSFDKNVLIIDDLIVSNIVVSKEELKDVLKGFESIQIKEILLTKTTCKILTDNGVITF
jgi:hypothetical protein